MTPLNLQAHNTLMQLCHKLLQEDDNFLEICRDIAAFSTDMDDTAREHFLPFIVVDSDTDTYPAPQTRHLYSDAFLEREDKQIAAYIKKSREELIQSCYHLIKIYGLERTDYFFSETDGSLNNLRLYWVGKVIAGSYAGWFVTLEHTDSLDKNPLAGYLIRYCNKPIFTNTDPNSFSVFEPSVTDWVEKWDDFTEYFKTSRDTIHWLWPTSVERQQSL